MNGGKEVVVPCLIYSNLTYEQEAEMYYLLDKTAGHLKLANSIKALLEAGTDPGVIDIKQRIERAGFTWALDRPTDAAYEIKATRAVLTAYRQLGGSAFSRMLNLLSSAWHGTQISLKSGMISGMALFLKTYETEIDDYAFIRRLALVEPYDIVQQAKVDFTTDKWNLRYARVIRLKYNEQRGGKKLPYRFKN